MISLTALRCYVKCDCFLGAAVALRTHRFYRSSPDPNPSKGKKKVNSKMQPRQSALRRPSGTDGSDFSYRMVVDPRYTKVAQGKSRLRKLIITQAVIQFAGALLTFSFLQQEEDYNRLAISSVIIGFISLLIGELGRRRSQANFLRLYAVASFIALLLSVVSVVRYNISLEVTEGQSRWLTKRFQLIEGGHVLLGFLVEIFTIITTFSLIHNMAPPKRAS